MDRNCERPLRVQTPMGVATREGGVDRNDEIIELSAVRVRSPPARVAWIEIHLNLIISGSVTVATREGGVDRNSLMVVYWG